MTRGAQTAAAVVAALALAAGAMVATSSCQQQPVSVPLRTLERSQRMDVVCLQVLDAAGGVLTVPLPQPASKCSPFAGGVDVSAQPYRLHALVTQSLRGELAVIDVTGAKVVDQDTATPGTNFIPVGALPTDVATAPNGGYVYVATAEPGKPALYAVPGDRLLGNSFPSRDAGGSSTPPPRITSWPVCLLPQAPAAVFTVLRAGEGEAGKYDVAVVLPGDERQPAAVLVMDPAPLQDGTIAPGSLAPCTGVRIALSGALPDSVGVGPAWPDGVPYVDGGVDLTGQLPPPPQSCVAAGAPADAGAVRLPPASEPPRASGAARDGTILYVADDARPVIHVIDMSNPASPRELSPLIATSISDTARKVSVGELAVSPSTHAASGYRKYLYAVDRRAGDVMVYDVTDPEKGPRVPLTRPHPELNPFQSADRIKFAAPVVALAFARFDWPLDRDSPDGNRTRTAALSGLLCNPSQKAGPGLYTDGVFPDPGANYRANTKYIAARLGPGRLRGVFGFATLSNGVVVVIDVDDWDAPCRRPDPLDATYRTGALAVPQPDPTSDTDFDPWHAPITWSGRPGDDTKAVSFEVFFPVIQPHRPRSLQLLRADTAAGNRTPNLAAAPQLFFQGVAVATSGVDSEANPTLLPTRTSFLDPSEIATPNEADPARRKPPENRDRFTRPGAVPGLRFSYEDPLVHIDQDWAVTYEGAVAGFDGVRAGMRSATDFASLELRVGPSTFCRKGIEDFALGQERAARAIAVGGGLDVGQRIERRVTDYVQVIDDVLPDTDPVWALADEPGTSCWESLGDQKGVPAARQKLCSDAFGLTKDQTVNVTRDFPILEAYDDHLVLGRYGYTQSNLTTATREVVERSPANASVLKQLYCCFHHQVGFRVRAGAQWVALGSNVQLLHHVKADPANGGRCVQSCDPRVALLNARSLEIARPPVSSTVQAPDRDSPLAMRNPIFSFVTWAGAPPAGGQRTTAKRDAQWRFAARGQFSPFAVNLGAQNAAVSPQSMRYIEALGSVAVVDGATQGLVFIDLRAGFQPRAPFL